MTLPQFYYFYTTVMNTLPIFYRDNVVKRSTSTTKGEDEICSICEENKVSVMLECYVSAKLKNFYLKK